MVTVSLQLDDVLVDFYRRIGLLAGLTTQQVMADALFRLAGELSMEAEKSAGRKNRR